MRLDLDRFSTHLVLTLDHPWWRRRYVVQARRATWVGRPKRRQVKFVYTTLSTHWLHRTATAKAKRLNIEAGTTQ